MSSDTTVAQAPDLKSLIAAAHAATTRPALHAAIDSIVHELHRLGIVDDIEALVSRQLLADEHDEHAVENENVTVIHTAKHVRHLASEVAAAELRWQATDDARNRAARDHVIALDALLDVLQAQGVTTRMLQDMADQAERDEIPF